MFKQIFHGLLVSPAPQDVLTVVHYSSTKLPAQLSVGEMNGKEGRDHSTRRRRERRKTDVAM